MPARPIGRDHRSPGNATFCYTGVVKKTLYRGYQAAFLRVYGWAAARLYNELAWAYDPVSAFVSAGRWSAWRELALDYVAGPRVLELGFGTGELLIEMRRRGFAVSGLDFSRAMHKVAARKLARRGLEVPRVRSRAETLPFASNAFDTVLATFPAGYILAPSTLRDVRRVLRPSGRFVIGGLIVKLPRSARYPLSIVPGDSWQRLWNYFQTSAAEAGLSSTVTWCAEGRVRVPIVVCTANSNASPANEGRSA